MAQEKKPRKPRTTTPRPSRTTREVTLLRQGIDQFFANTKDEQGRKVCVCKFGIYAFYDYDGEPIYVGQTRERIQTRIRRHLTNQRTDAVAMSVLDPFEVLDIEVWPLYELEKVSLNPASPKQVAELLTAAEHAVHTKLLAESRFQAVLNEKGILSNQTIELPNSYRGCIVPAELFAWRNDPDIRLARRAATIAKLTQVISERDVSHGLRKTLLTQAKRLQWLAEKRFLELGGEAKVEVKTAADSDKD